MAPTVKLTALPNSQQALGGHNKLQWLKESCDQWTHTSGSQLGMFFNLSYLYLGTSIFYYMGLSEARVPQTLLDHG